MGGSFCQNSQQNMPLRNLFLAAFGWLSEKQCWLGSPANGVRANPLRFSSGTKTFRANPSLRARILVWGARGLRLYPKYSQPPARSSVAAAEKNVRISCESAKEVGPDGERAGGDGGITGIGQVQRCEGPECPLCQELKISNFESTVR